MMVVELVLVVVVMLMVMERSRDDSQGMCKDGFDKVFNRSRW